MLATRDRYRDARAKRMYYLSIEYLLGRCLGNNLCNMGIEMGAKNAVCPPDKKVLDAIKESRRRTSGKRSGPTTTPSTPRN